MASITMVSYPLLGIRFGDVVVPKRLEIPTPGIARRDGAAHLVMDLYTWRRQLHN